MARPTFTGQAAMLARLLPKDGPVLQALPGGGVCRDPQVILIMDALGCSHSKAKHLLRGRQRLFFDDACKLAVVSTAGDGAGDAFAKYQVLSAMFQKASDGRDERTMYAFAFFLALGGVMLQESRGDQ